MSSYYPSFSYTSPNGIRYNSFIDKNLRVVHFEGGDESELDTFLGMDCIYSDNAYGTKRFDYGAKYKDVAVIRISVMKPDGENFSVSDVRDFLRWVSGSRNITCLDLSDIVQNEETATEVIKFTFVGRVTAVYQQKMDSRTVGFTIEHTSISPYAYSPIQNINCSFNQVLNIDDDNILYNTDGTTLSYDNGIVTNYNRTFDMAKNGSAYIGNSTYIRIKNETDDLSDYVYMDVVVDSNTSDSIAIKNRTLYEQSNHKDGLTEIDNMHKNETLTLSSGQFITSSSGRTLGNDFNFVWPKLIPGDNDFVVDGAGDGSVRFAYRYPVKIGDCAIDFDVANNTPCWERI